MWPFRKKPDLWRLETEERLYALHEAYRSLAGQCRDVQAAVEQRSPLQHRHSLDDIEEHYHDIPGEHFEHKHEYEAVHQVATPKGPRLEGTVECPGCHARYDLQADCRLGDARQASIVCVCGHTIEVDGAGK